MNMHVYLSSLP